MYPVFYSGRVIDALRDLVARNRAHATQILAAVREIDRRLRIYPQFGQPLWDLVVEPAQLWIAVVSPLVVHYVLDEGDGALRGRQVMVVRPFTPLLRLGIV